MLNQLPMANDLFNLAYTVQVFPGGSEVKNLSANAGIAGLIPGSGRSPGGGNSNPLQCSCLENPRDRGAWWATALHIVRCCWACMHTLMPIMYNKAFIKTGRDWVWVDEHMETQGDWRLEKTQKLSPSSPGLALRISSILLFQSYILL